MSEKVESYPQATHVKTGELVRDSLIKKHPDGRGSSTACLETFNAAPELNDMQMTDDKV